MGFCRFCNIQQLFLSKIKISCFPIVEQDRPRTVTPITPRKALLIQAAVLCLGLVCGLLLHEGLHGLLMRLGGGSRIRLGFIGLRPYMQCSACFDRRSYRRILLLPALLWEILLLVAVILVPAGWKWTLYILLIGNTAAGWEDISLLLMTRSGGAEALYQHRGTVAEVYRKA